MIHSALLFTVAYSYPYSLAAWYAWQYVQLICIQIRKRGEGSRTAGVAAQ